MAAETSDPYSETLELSSISLADQPSGHHARIALIEGSTPQLSGEMQSVLRGRLRTSALLLCLAFLSFLIYSLFRLDEIKTTVQWAVFWGHLTVTLVTGALATMLCRRCEFTLRKLRVAELLIFGSSAAFFVLLLYSRLIWGAERGFIPAVAGPWLVLMYTYALFVPNTWRRAAWVIGAMAIAPLAVQAYVWAVNPRFAALLGTTDYAGSMWTLGILMAATAVSAVVGVHTIGSLRREAFEARQLGQYRLKERLGSGGMGEVYLAEHQLLKRACAIKVIRPEKAGDPRVLARFEREVRSTARLSHWNTVDIFDYGRTDEGTFYYVMEYLPGYNIGDLVENHGPLSAERAIYLLAQTCEALHEAHSHHLVHRDLKPGNLFAAQRGGAYDVAKLLDFGLVKPLADLDDSKLTREGTITGSPLFMSPEQAMGEQDTDARSDIYSLGAVAYYMLTGRAPFEHDRPMKVMMDHVHTPVVAPSELRPEVPEDLELVVLRCLAKDPQDRYPDAEAVRAALLDCDAAGLWDRETAKRWWEEYGCPQKRAKDKAVLAAAGA